MNIQNVVAVAVAAKNASGSKSALPGTFPEDFCLDPKVNGTKTLAWLKSQSKFLSAILLSSPDGISPLELAGILRDSGYTTKAGDSSDKAAMKRCDSHFNGIKSQQIPAFKNCAISEKDGKWYMTATKGMAVMTIPTEIQITPSEPQKPSETYVKTSGKVILHKGKK
jgi:hypothetical protein